MMASVQWLTFVLVDEDTKKEFEEIQSKSPLSSATGPASQSKDFSETRRCV